MADPLAPSPTAQALIQRLALAIGNGASPSTVDRLFDEVSTAFATDLTMTPAEVRDFMLHWIRREAP